MIHSSVLFSIGCRDHITKLELRGVIAPFEANIADVEAMI
jgi:hypothetical protein